MDLRDPATFARVYAEHAPAAAHAAAGILGGAGRRHEVDDVVADVFLRLWREPRRFDPDRGGLGPYLRMMSRSRALDLLRQGRAAAHATDRVADAEQRRSATDLTAQTAERRASRAALLDAMAALPGPQREAIALACWGDLTAEQIARRSGVPLGTAKGRIRLGLARLRVELETADVATAGLLGALTQLL